MYKKVLIVTLILLILSSLFLQINTTASMPKGVYFLPVFYSKIKAGDVVGFDLPVNTYQRFKDNGIELEKELALVKYVGAVENDKVCVFDNKLYVNDKLLKEYNLKEFTTLLITGCFVVNKDEYFLIGDSEFSLDSRFIGVIYKNQIERKGYLLFKVSM